MEQYYNFIQNGDKNQIDEWLKQVDAAYSSGNEAMQDQTYDYLIQAYEKRFGKRTVVGSEPIRNPSKLPVAMMSLDKIMKEKELKNFMNKNPGPYVVMDKINGNSGLYEIKKGVTRLYNRGDGTTGTNLTDILPFLNLPVLPFDVHIKGELVIDKKDYQPYKQDYRTNLSMVNGLLNSQSPDPTRLKLLRFIAFDMSFPNNPEIVLPMSQTLVYLSKYGFVIPFNTVVPTLTIEWLSLFFKQQKENQSYDVDGMVIVADRPVPYEERLIRDNPKYAIAFKEYGDVYETLVTDVIWEASKHGVIKPVVHVQPVAVGDTGFTIRKATGFNAKWIVDNKVGPGAKIMVTHNTIPYITGVVTGTEPKLPPIEKFPMGSWKWNDTNVDIVLLNDTDEVKIAKIYEFFKQIGAKYWGETTLEKFYNAGYNTIKIMVESGPEVFKSRPIDGIGEGIIDRMIRTRDEALPNVTIPQLMSASGMFGLGFGKRKIRAILNVYPNILQMNPTVNQIAQIDGFADKTAQRFVDGLPKFKQFVASIPILQQVINGTLQPVKPISQTVQSQTINSMVLKSSNNNSIMGKSVVFTGFRDKDLENAIEANGGSIKTSVSKKTSYVLVGGPKGRGSGKEKKAIQYGIPVLSVEEFKTMFFG